MPYNLRSSQHDFLETPKMNDELGEDSFNIRDSQILNALCTNLMSPLPQLNFDSGGVYTQRQLSDGERMYLDLEVAADDLQQEIKPYPMDNGMHPQQPYGADGVVQDYGMPPSNYGQSYYRQGQQGLMPDHVQGYQHHPLQCNPVPMGLQPADIGFALSQNATGHRFTVFVTPQEKATNKDYLIDKNLLFTKISTFVPFSFTLAKDDEKARAPFLPIPPNHFIRVYLRFSSPTGGAIVQRCPVHKQKDREASSTLADFIIRCQDKAAEYRADEQCIIVPARPLINFKFECFSSCAGGIDRKSVEVVFELLDESMRVQLDAKIGLKVCANPSRDAPKDAARETGSRKSSEARADEVKSEEGEDDLNDPSAIYDGRGKKNKRRIVPGGTPVCKKRTLAVTIPEEDPDFDTPKMQRAVHNSKPGSSGFSGRTRAGTSRYVQQNDEKPGEGRSGQAGRAAHYDEDGDTFTLTIKGRDKFLDVMQYVKRLEVNERYETRKNPEDPLYNVSQISPDLPIDRWFNHFNIDVTDSIAAYFAQFNIQCVADLEQCYTQGFFHQCASIDRDVASSMEKVFLNYANVKKADEATMSRTGGSAGPSNLNSQPKKEKAVADPFSFFGRRRAHPGGTSLQQIVSEMEHTH